MSMSDRPVLILDLDGVIYDWVGAMRSALSQYAGVEKPLFDPNQWAVWDAWDVPKGLFMQCWRRGIEDGWLYNYGPPIGGAATVDALWRISDLEWDIQIATSRLNMFGLHHQVVTQTADWLNQYRIPYRGLSFTDRKTLKGLVMVDDKPGNLETANVELALLWDMAHNRNEMRYPRVHDMEDLFEWVEARE